MKLNLDLLGSLENQTSAIQVLNENSERIEAAIENTLSRDGTAPNEMEVDLDLNGYQILNLGAPLSGTDAVRLIDLQESQALDAVVVPPMFEHEGDILTTDGAVLVFSSPADVGLGDLVSTNNLSDLDDAPTARDNLGLGSAAEFDVGATGNVVPLMDGVANGWTGSNTFAGAVGMTGGASLGGTEDYVLNNTPTVIADQSVGFRGIPSATVDTDYTFVLGDSGRAKLHTSAVAHTYTIPLNATVPYPIGTVLIADNIGSGALSIARTGGVTLRRAGIATDADATVAQWGSAAIRKLATNTWVIQGVNVS